MSEKRTKKIPYERDFARARLSIAVTEALWEELERSGLQQTELADRLDVSRAHISQALGTGRNLTLRTLADICWALDCRVSINLHPARFDESFISSSGVIGLDDTPRFADVSTDLPSSIDLPAPGTNGYAHAA